MKREVVGVAVFIGVTLFVAWIVGRAAIKLANAAAAQTADDFSQIH